MTGVSIIKSISLADLDKWSEYNSVYMKPENAAQVDCP